MAEKEAREAEATIAHLRENRRHADADELEKKLAVHRQQLEEYKRLAAEEEVRLTRNDPKNIDFANPTPEQIADNPASHTGRYLKRLLSAVSA